MSMTGFDEQSFLELKDLSGGFGFNWDQNTTSDIMFKKIIKV